MQPHQATVAVEAHLDIIQRIQKLELATNRLIADSGNVGEGFKSIALTSKENMQNLQQQKMIDQLLERLDGLESSGMKKLQDQLDD